MQGQAVSDDAGARGKSHEVVLEGFSDLVREMPAFAAERMMNMEIEVKAGAPADSRSQSRLNHRNE